MRIAVVLQRRRFEAAGSAARRVTAGVGYVNENELDGRHPIADARYVDDDL
jgi:hypothetical protein